MLALATLTGLAGSAFSQQPNSPDLKNSEPPAATRLRDEGSPAIKRISEGDLREQIGALDAKVTVVELILKNHQSNENELREWAVRKDSIQSLSSHASELLKNGASETERGILGVSLGACNSALELYLKELAQEKRTTRATTQAQPAGRTQAQPDIVGVYDVASFEGFKLGTKVMLPMIKEQMARSQIPEDSQRILTNALARIGEARDPRELTRTVDALLTDSQATGDTKRIAHDFFSLLSRHKRSAPETRTVTLQNTATGWKSAWESVVAEDRTPRLHAAGKANYEWNCFIALAKSADGLKQITTSASHLAAHFENKDEKMVADLKLVAGCKTSDELSKLDRRVLATMRRATEEYSKTENK